ncbi:START domain-containing protein 10 isoform X1 [Macaca mulatta]|uniref:START domain-containing protein 10 n=1 Tax=Macaca mulatta TaxID=9544 RepID=A0A5F7ZQ19_MACMU
MEEELALGPRELGGASRAGRDGRSPGAGSYGALANSAWGGPRKVASASATASTLSEPPRRTQENRTRARALGLPTLPMEKPAASTEPQGPRPVLGRESVQVPDDQDFRSFRSECEAEVGWNLTYSKAGVSVWVQAVEMDRTLHKIKCRMECRDVPAETLYDVLHDIEYRKKWDSNVIETFDIARLTVNADVGYYSWRCPKPLKNRDVITLRSWLPMGADYIIMNYSVKHPKYPPRKDLVRAVSIQTGYLIQSTGPKSCVITYLAQVDPKGSLPKWVVNKSSQFLAPKAMKKMYKACLKYPEWKQKHLPHFKPWLHPEQSPLPSLALSELSVQHADSLENIDESAVAESREERMGGAGGEGSDDDTSLT